MTTGGATRAFEPDPVPDEVLHRILDKARFAPSGGNRQGWRVIVVRDPDTRRRIRELQTLGWREYIAFAEAGRVAFAASDDGVVRLDGVDLDAARDVVKPNPFVDALDVVPVLLVLLADLTQISFMDCSLKRQNLVGGASIYPFAHNIILAARNEGLGGVMTTVICRQEPAAREVLGIPDHVAIASVIALGRPSRALTKLTRKPVEEFTTVDRYDGNAWTL